MPADSRPDSAGVVLWRPGAGSAGPEVALLDAGGGPTLPARRVSRGSGSALVTALALARDLDPAPGPPGARLESRGGRAGSRIFWPVESHRQGPVTDAAHDRLQWVSAQDAVDALVRATDRRVVRTFVADLAPRRPVVLVRHARAGKRGRWAGRDEDRPLDRRGRAQADALVDLLAGYQLERIHSSDARRCLDTVRPLADAISMPVQEDRLLGETAALADPAGARATLLHLVQEPGRAVICGQRKSLDLTLPSLMAEIGVSGNVLAPRKGGVLVLHLAENGARTVVEAFEPLA